MTQDNRQCGNGDEAPVGQKSTHAYIWAPVGSRPAMARDNRHDIAYIFGAVCPVRSTGAALITPAANTDWMNEHLAEISTQAAPGAVAALIWHGAGWHRCTALLGIADNIVLRQLPPHSPELNPMKNVWAYLRANKLSARVWHNCDAILKACVAARNFLIADPDRIRPIGTRDGAPVNV